MKSFFGSKDTKESTEDKDETLNESEKSDESKTDATNDETAKQNNETVNSTDTKEGANAAQDQTKKSEKVNLKVDWIPRGLSPLSPEQKKIASAR